MSEWVVVPCLLTLRDEFNRVSPKRDKGADGTIGDSSHKSSSDHTPDEDSDILRDHDADSKNEVHALDIDSSGPWPGGWAWFNAAILAIVERHRTGQDNRLKYVIWNRRIASKSNGWKWITYTGTSDPHTDHTHFSAVYTTAQEQDTSPWGVWDGSEDMALEDDLIGITGDTAKEIGAKAGDKKSAATLLQLALIYAARADDKAAAASEAVSALSGRLTAIESALSTLAGKVGSQPPAPAGQGTAPTAAEIADELAQRLQA